MAYESYNALLMSHAGLANREKNLTHTKRVMRSTFADSPSYFQVQVNDGYLIETWIVDDSKVKDQKEIISLDYLLKNGDIIDWQCEKWINILTDNMSDIYYRGTLRRCVGELKWLNSEGLPLSCPFTFKSDTATNFGVQDGRIMTLGNERRNLMAPLNDDTKQFQKGKRFIFDGRVWDITSIDSISVQGLLILTVEEGIPNMAIDNFELGIPDYFGKVANYTLTILNETNFSIRAAKTLQLNVELRNNGILAIKPLKYTSSNTSIANVDANGLITTIANGNVVITVSMLDNSAVTDSINGIVEFTTHNNYVVSLTEIEPSVYLNKSKTFTAVVKNNGIVDNSKFVNWSLFADNKISSTSLATMTSSSTTQCTLKGNDSEVGYVQLRLFVIGESQPHWIRVRVKSLI